MSKLSRDKIGNALGSAMRDFGYPDCTNSMALDVFDSYCSGNRHPELPHGVIGGMLEGSIDDLLDGLPAPSRALILSLSEPVVAV